MFIDNCESCRSHSGPSVPRICVLLYCVIDICVFMDICEPCRSHSGPSVSRICICCVVLCCVVMCCVVDASHRAAVPSIPLL
jgi:hypothetical protein